MINGISRKPLKIYKMEIFKKSDKLFLRCECHGHALEIINDSEMAESGNAYFYVTVWSQYQEPLTIKTRLKIIWSMIRGRRIDGGDVVLTQKTANDLVKFLTKKIDENRTISRRVKKQKEV